MCRKLHTNPKKENRLTLAYDTCKIVLLHTATDAKIAVPAFDACLRRYESFASIEVVLLSQDN